jgi:prepilin-type processing-associated H-X9-DG protein
MKWTPGGGNNIGGWKSVFVLPSECYWSMGGYNYAGIVPPRAGAGSSPNFRGAVAFPREVWSQEFTDWVTKVWEPRNPGVKFRMPNAGVLVTDPWIGTGSPPHSNGKSVNVAYSDGHVRNHRITNPTNSGQWMNICEAWWYFTTRP